MCKKTKNILCFGELLNVIYWILSKVGMSQGEIKKVYTYILYIPLFLVDYSLSSIKKIYLEIDLKTERFNDKSRQNKRSYAITENGAMFT
jgi:hypothetical protein